MSIEKTYPFDNPLNYTFDANKVEISGGEAKLKLDQAPVVFQQNFDNDTGFTYDPSKLEFASGTVIQKFITTSDELFRATAEFQADADKFQVDGTATAVNGATITNVGGNNYYDISNAINGQYYTFNGANAGFTQTGTIRFKIIPNYNISPTANRFFFSLIGAGDDSNITMFHQSSQNVQMRINNTSGTLASTINFGNWSVIQGQEYELELNFDFNGGSHELFIDGVKFGVTGTSAITRNPVDDLYFGSNAVTANSEFYLRDIQIFDTVQHTADFPGEIPRVVNNYEESDLILPEKEHVGLGGIVSFDSIVTIEENNPGYTFQIGQSGNYLYYNGVAWVISDGTYAQSNDITTVNDNLGSLPVSGEIYFQIKMLFPQGSNRGLIDSLTANFTEDSGYFQDNPRVEINEAFQSDGLLTFIEASTKTANTEIKYILKKDTTWYYHDGANWVVSDETYAQSNTATEVQANISTFTTTGVTVKIALFLNSTDINETPIMDQLDITYDFYAGSGDLIEKCIVWFDAIDIQGNPVTNQNLTIKISQPNVQYKTSTMTIQSVETVTPNAQGRFEVALVETDNMVGSNIYYTFTINKQSYKRTVPNVISSSFWDLPPVT